MDNKLIKENERTTYKQKTDNDIQDVDGALDGITIFRFAHMWRSSNVGGVEAYLSNLNNHLLKRNKMRILQMYLVHADVPLNMEIEPIGRGELVWIPSYIKSNSAQQMNIAQWIYSKIKRLKRCQVDICHDFLLSSLANYKINLALFHWISEDSPIVFDYFNERNIPYAVVNHFQNSRLNIRVIKKQISAVRSIGGVSNVDVPSFLRSRFANLSDGIDTDFFNPLKAVPLESKSDSALILLPSRITEGKGHLDAVKALCLLVNDAVDAVLAFAGVTSSPVLMSNLQRTIMEKGLQERVIFTGNLSAEELRNWYAASSVVVLPSFSEGLGKVLLEAQAMEKPTVAYNVGGVPEAIEHSVTGYLVKKGDVEGLARRLKELIYDPEKRHEMGERGRKLVIERFSMQSLTIRHEEFIRQCIE
jgi:glycosyltransferase involved in cell wall biosynthesis